MNVLTVIHLELNNINFDADKSKWRVNALLRVFFNNLYNNLHLKKLINILGTFSQKEFLRISFAFVTVLMMALIKRPTEKRQFPSGVICVWKILHWFHMHW